MAAIERRLFAATVSRGDIADEPQWLDSARRGESWALERLYDAFQPSVYRLCYRLLGNAEDAEDALQATFIHAFTGLPRFRGGSRVRTWLYSIAVRQAADLRRRRGNTLARTALLDDDISLPDTTAGVADRLAVRRALDALQPDFRTILVLRFWEELDYEDIARVLSLTMPTVKMRLKRARDAFRRQYEQHEAEGDGAPVR